MYEAKIITSSGEDLKLYNGVLSTNDSLELSTRFAHDGSKKSQTVTRRRRNTALAGTVRVAVTSSAIVADGNTLARYMAKMQDTVGTLVTLVWYGKEYKNILVKSVQATPTIDAIDTFSDVQMAISWVEGYTRKKTASTKVSAMKSPV